MAKKAVKKAATPKKAIKKTSTQLTVKASKKGAKKVANVAGKKSTRKPVTVTGKKRAPEKALPHNMTANEPLVGKRHPDEGVPAIEKRVKTKTVVAGKAKQITVPVRTGVGGGRPGGGGTGELSPTSDTAAGRGHGQRRKKH